MPRWRRRTPSSASREAALHNIQLAEQYAKGQVDVLMATGDAFLALGDRDAAMQRFSRALEDPQANRLGIRLAIAEIFVREGQWDEARRQIGLGFAEARMSESPRVTPTDFVAAANIFLATAGFRSGQDLLRKSTPVRCQSATGCDRPGEYLSGGRG